MNVVYVGIPEVLDGEILGLVSRWGDFLPRWVDTLTVIYDDTQPNIASADGVFEQRVAKLWIHPQFWSLDKRSRDITILHEIAHILMAPLDQCVDTIIKFRPENALAEKLYSDAVEGYVNDFASIAWLSRQDKP